MYLYGSRIRVFSLMIAHPLIELNAAGTMLCTEAELLARVAILEAIHNNFPAEISTVAEADEAVGDAVRSSGGRRVFVYTSRVIPSVLHIRCQIRASEFRASCDRRLPAKARESREIWRRSYDGGTVLARIPTLLAALLLTQGAATALTHSHNVRTDGFEAGLGMAGSMQSNARRAMPCVSGSEAYDLTVPINYLKNDCTRWPFAFRGLRGITRKTLRPWLSPALTAT